MTMWLKCCLLGLVAVTFQLTIAETWSGHVCSRRVNRYRFARVCRYRFLGWCDSYKYVRQGYWTTEQFCCHGWKHGGDNNCNILKEKQPTEEASTGSDNTTSTSPPPVSTP
ncbi:uncharacterized protein LOC143301139 isoform X1 [Babylonia areolata]|uniref:uncharacterized protein LOC143301139 isoform X1 n=1 Tax=Babylonia areolata TaxID=304850 RepID=UPI003FD591BF